MIHKKTEGRHVKTQENLPNPKTPHKMPTKEQLVFQISTFLAVL